ncbi:nudC domain-containing protein 2 isoform X2 [Ascaphus truei]|uniref:nudC domain-containing protein 2 isoform X2 n=1 Tax=Ascaphus truei TaxID=8439 RepID=UPI003F5ABE34
MICVPCVRARAVLCPTPPSSPHSARRPVVMSVHFDERSGVVPCHTPWGCWYQTMEDVFIEVEVPPGTQAREIQCKLGSRDIALAVQGRDILKGKLFDSTITDEGTWTLEDRKLIRIILMKSNRNAANCWASLLEGEYSADPLVQDQMQKKLTLERFQREVPEKEKQPEPHLFQDGSQQPSAKLLLL